MSDSTAPVGQTSTASQRRRSSAAGKFGSLMEQKRGSQDLDAAARRASITDQYKQPSGMLGKMWNNFTRGEAPAANAGTQQQGINNMAKQSIHKTGAGTMG